MNTDNWRGYSKLNTADFNHFCVNHSYNVVDLQNAVVHTQTIESLWSKLKRDMQRIQRNSTARFKTYLTEYQ
ncbi:MAG: transposase [Candidatus Karelsulcia muelleri]